MKAATSNRRVTSLRSSDGIVAALLRYLGGHMLSLAFGSTVHAFELMLSAFIGGLACGGLWIRKRIDGYAHPVRVGGWVQLAMGMAALLSLLLYDRSFDWVAWFLQAISRTDGGYALYNFVTATVSLLLMAPAAFFAGMTLPLFTYSLLRSGGGEASVGRIYAANTIGAIVGVFAAVHFLVPMLGLKLAMQKRFSIVDRNSADFIVTSFQRIAGNDYRIDGFEEIHSIDVDGYKIGALYKATAETLAGRTAP